MAITLRTRGDASSLAIRFSARVVTSAVDLEERRDCVLLLNSPDDVAADTPLDGYSALITTPEIAEQLRKRTESPVVAVRDLDHLRAGHIVTVEPRTGFVLTAFRPESRHNVIFTTERCNSNCLMCSQPPKDVDDTFRVQEYLRIISLIREPPEFLCITGGEPTLLGDGLLQILSALKTKFPTTRVQMLTNGRSYRDPAVTRAIADVGHPNLISAVPLYADAAGVHDYIVQAEGAFDETVEGLYNAEQAGLALEIRVVLHKQSIPRLRQLANYIYRNFPFAAHVALMGLENMGYVKKNWDLLWIDPVEYMDTLEDVVRFLWLRRMNVSIYNLQLCLLPKSLWSVARRSISDYKNVYLDECQACSQRDHCAGLFLSQVNRHSAHIRACR
jgi:His-Xaa-Ser system radical SAM maturase HxsC